ncbi:MAG: hypothetical protein HRU19_13705 [Pseudobacteriovorax sp.]|nr:hypothetical protein [Pseudobacteriovorax sp.]
MQANPEKFFSFPSVGGETVANFWSWWAEPSSGIYCLTRDRQVLRRHAEVLGDMGVDFIVLDISNWPNVKEDLAEEQIIQPLLALLDEWSRIPNAPKVVGWTPFQNFNSSLPKERRDKSKLIPAMVDLIASLLKNNYPQLIFRAESGKGLLLEVDDTDRFSDQQQKAEVWARMQGDWDIYKMWGLRDISRSGREKEWSFLSTCSNESMFLESFGFDHCHQSVSRVQIPVVAGYQKSYVTREPTVRKFYGRTLVSQFSRAFDPQLAQIPFIFITGWNEWMAQIQKTGPGEGPAQFVDLFDEERNRDLEPGGKSGSYYKDLVKN